MFPFCTHLSRGCRGMKTHNIYGDLATLTLDGVDHILFISCRWQGKKTRPKSSEWRPRKTPDVGIGENGWFPF